MRPRFAASVIGLLALAGAATAQTGIPGAPHAQRRPGVPQETGAAGTPGPTDLDATRKRFD